MTRLQQLSNTCLKHLGFFRTNTLGGTVGATTAPTVRVWLHTVPQEEGKDTLAGAKAPWLYRHEKPPLPWCTWQPLLGVHLCLHAPPLANIRVQTPVPPSEPRLWYRECWFQVPKPLWPLQLGCDFQVLQTFVAHEAWKPHPSVYGTCLSHDSQRPYIDL